ncbi:probable ascorbate-specific transmembrane electron transporter 1 [Ananas comosus]|uniref:Probable ascorbate-specific transmembrane electron transporter 1 n=1 Tax=Ananas comosus TaxID=4615 RepID=A0A6P5G3L7_ANACO|nr:probable ascorbate-specific transmembrane electron transporter 1 [Ananas comosus]
MALSANPKFLLAATHARTVAHILALVAVILMLVWVLHYRGGANLRSDADPELIFNVHPLVMSLGFIVVIGEAIMAYKTVPTEKKVRKFIHMMLHFVALTLGIFGIYAAFKYHKESASPDMLSLHSWLGICTICLFGLQWLFGFFYFWLPRGPAVNRAMVKPLHASAGLAIFLMAICTAETGLVDKGGLTVSETQLINFTGLFILLFGVAVSIVVALPKIV